MDLESEKARQRQRALAARRAIAPAQAERAALRVAEHVCASPEYARAERLALYAASGGEISTRPLFEAARAAGKRCVFPRCRRGFQLDFAGIDRWELLVPGQFGLLEPEAAWPACQLEPGDLVLVPGVAFDRRGGRVGQGGGYYDRAFPAGSGPGPFLMGLAHSVQLLDTVAVEPHDRTLDAIATESGILRAGRGEVR